MPADTPSISAGTSTIQAMPSASRKPVSTCVTMPGSTICRTTSLRVADRLCASCSQLLSSAATPAAVLSRMGQTAANVSRNTTGASPTPSAITASGIHDSGETMRRNWNSVPVSLANSGDSPTQMPTGTAINSASSSEMPMRCRLSRICSQSAPSASSRPSAAKPAVGANAVRIASTSDSWRAPSDHSATASASPTTGQTTRSTARLMPRLMPR